MSNTQTFGMLIQPTENGFLVTETAPPSANLYRPARYWVFIQYEDAARFIGLHFAGDNPATLPPANSIAEAGQLIGASSISNTPYWGGKPV